MLYRKIHESENITSTGEESGVKQLTIIDFQAAILGKTYQAFQASNMTRA